MTTPAIQYLKAERDRQAEKLDALKAHHKNAIDAGQRALREVESQSRHVTALGTAILDLEDAERRNSHEVEA